MHKKLILLLFFSYASFTFAQTRLIKPEIYVGVNGGMTSSWVIFNPKVDQSWLPGINGGLVFRYIAEKNVGMQAELNFSQRGWKEANGLFSRQLNYIELPFMTHIYIGQKTRFIINLGPKIAYMISDRVLTNNTVGSTAIQQITATQNKFDYGLCAGFGLMFPIGKNYLQFDTRAYYALSDVYSNSKKDYFAHSNNLNVSANLAWLVRLK